MVKLRDLQVILLVGLLFTFWEHFFLDLTTAFHLLSITLYFTLHHVLMQKTLQFYILKCLSRRGTKGGGSLPNVRF